MDYNVTFRKKDKGIQAIISYKDNNGIWKQKSKQGFETQKAAKPWIEKTVDDLKETVGYINPEYDKTTFKELFDSYVKHIDLYKEANTLNSYDVAEKKFDKLSNIEVIKITSLEIQECIDVMVKSKLKSSSIKTYTSKIGIIFKYAIEMHIIKDDPLASVVLPKNKSNAKKEIKALNKSETTDLLNRMYYTRHYLISLIATTCGLRIGEILGLTWDNIDEKNSTVTISKQWKRIEKKPVKYGVGPVKSKNSNRTVPIPPSTMAELKRYKEKHPIDISNRLFAYSRTDSISTALKVAYKRAGYDISVHDLRHTYASTLVANGLDFKTVAELMGHTVNETIRTYSHFTNDMMVRATKVVNSIF